jgi:hypothetical protein
MITQRFKRVHSHDQRRARCRQKRETAVSIRAKGRD